MIWRYKLTADHGVQLFCTGLGSLYCDISGLCLTNWVIFERQRHRENMPWKVIDSSTKQQ